MSELPSHASASGHAYLQLRELAKRTGRQTDELLKFYALEGFLQRLARSPHVEEYVLKGGLLLAAFAARRPTRDIDLQGRNTPNDVTHIVALVDEILAISIDDGLAFVIGSTRGETIRDDDEYSGVRVSVDARLHNAVVDFHIDISFGDPIWPDPVPTELPLLLGGNLSLQAYPLTLVLAEKTITALQRGTANTRWRDFADLTLLSAAHSIDGDEFTEALRVVATYRRVSLTPLADVLVGWAETAQRHWVIWRRRQRLELLLPENFGHILIDCTRFCDPALTGQAAHLTWSPSRQRWLTDDGNG